MIFIVKIRTLMIVLVSYTITVVPTCGSLVIWDVVDMYLSDTPLSMDVDINQDGQPDIQFSFYELISESSPPWVIPFQPGSQDRYIQIRTVDQTQYAFQGGFTQEFGPNDIISTTSSFTGPNGSVSSWTFPDTSGNWSGWRGDYTSASDFYIGILLDIGGSNHVGFINVGFDSTDPRSDFVVKSFGFETTPNTSIRIIPEPSTLILVLVFGGLIRYVRKRSI